MNDLIHIRTNIQALHIACKSWYLTGKAFGISKPMARLIANGYHPGAKTRRILGIGRHHRDLWAWPVGELRKAIMQREEWK
jgi:alpha-mannosidase